MKSMTEGKPLGLILRFAFPILLGNLLQQLYNVADASIVGRFLGAEALAAVGATSSVQFLILGFCTGACAGFCVPVAQKFGAQDFSSMRRLIFNSAFLTAIIAGVVTVSCALLTPQILWLLNTPENIWDNTYIYILIIFLGIPFTLLYNLAAGILRAIGDSRTPFIILAVSTVANVVLDLFCISVLNWGCAGAAIATVASQAASGILCLFLMIKKYEVLHLDRDERVVNKSLCGTLLSMGLPMGLQFSITAIGSMVMQSANNGLGSMYATAFTAAARIKMFAMCPFDAIATAVATFCGQNYGAGRADRVETGFHVGTVTAVIYGAVSGAALVLFGRTACLIFLSASEVEILDAAALYLRTLGYFYWVLGLLNVSRITVQGLGYSGRAVFSGVMEMIARSVVALFFVPHFGFTGISAADPTAWIAATLYILPMCLLTIRKVKQELSSRERAAALQVRARKVTKRRAAVL